MGRRLSVVTVVGMACAVLQMGGSVAVAGEKPAASTRDIEVGPAPAPSEPGFSLRIWPDRDSRRYRVGEHVSFFVETSRDCYLTLLNIGTSGQVKLLLPNQFQRGNLISGGVVHTLPPKAGPYTYTASGPPGTEGVMAICALDNVPVVSQSFVITGQVFYQVPGPPEAVRKDIEAQLKPVARERWVTVTMTVDVEPIDP